MVSKSVGAKCGGEKFDAFDENAEKQSNIKQKYPTQLHLFAYSSSRAAAFSILQQITNSVF